MLTNAMVYFLRFNLDCTTKVLLTKYLSSTFTYLRPYETRNLTCSGMIDTPYYFVLDD